MRLAIVLAAILCSVPSLAAEDVYPKATIRIVSGFGPGSAPDVAARVLAEAFTEAWGKPVVVENFPGAGGNLAADRVAKASPDGHTLLMAGNAAIVINQSIYAKLPYDPVRDLVPITQVALSPNILALSKDIPATNITELVELARQKPGALTFASAGIGTSTHLAGELFKVMSGIDIRHVPYRDNAALMADLVAGRTSMFFGNIASVLPQVRQGNLRAIAVTSLARSSAIPDLPTMDELGFKGFEASSWFGLMAPAGTPAPVITALQAEVAKVIATDKARAKFASLGMEPVTNTPETFAALIKAEIPAWAKLIQQAGIKPIE